MVREEKPVGSLIKGVIIKKQKSHKAGLHLQVRHGRVYIYDLTDTVINNPLNNLKIGDEVFEVQGQQVDQIKGGINAIRQMIEDDQKICVLARRNDPDESSVSTDSLYDGHLEEDWEELNEDGEDEGSEDDDNVGVERLAICDGPKFEVQIGEIYQLRSLAKKELNGSLVKVLREDENKADRWKVEVRVVKQKGAKVKVKDVISVATEKLFRIIRIGDTMRIKNYKAEPGWNGCDVTIKKRASKDPNNVDWIVEFVEDEEVATLPAKNLEHV